MNLAIGTLVDLNGERFRVASLAHHENGSQVGLMPVAGPHENEEPRDLAIDDNGNLMLWNTPNGVARDVDIDIHELARVANRIAPRQVVPPLLSIQFEELPSRDATPIEMRFRRTLPNTEWFLNLDVGSPLFVNPPYERAQRAAWNAQLERDITARIREQLRGTDAESVEIDRTEYNENERTITVHYRVNNSTAAARFELRAALPRHRVRR